MFSSVRAKIFFFSTVLFLTGCGPAYDTAYYDPNYQPYYYQPGYVVTPPTTTFFFGFDAGRPRHRHHHHRHH